MNQRDRDAFARQLVELRDEIAQLATTGDAAAAIVTLDQTAVGRLSRMDAMQAQAMSLNARQRRESTLKAIERALLRLRDDEFGDCMDCDEPIAHARLQFDPTATLCISCATGREAQT